jgi:hypothetical protein
MSSANRGRLVIPLPISVKGCYAYPSSSLPSQPPPPVGVHSPVSPGRANGRLHCRGGRLRRSGGRWPARGGAAPRESGAAGVVPEVCTAKHSDSWHRLWAVSRRGVGRDHTIVLRSYSSVRPEQAGRRTGKGRGLSRARTCTTASRVSRPLYAFTGFLLQGRGLIRCADPGVAYGHVLIDGLI